MESNHGGKQSFCERQSVFMSTRSEMRKPPVIFVLLAIGVFAVVGCGGGGGSSSSPPAPPLVDATGRWIGPYNSSVFGSQTATLIAQQVGASCTGTFASSTGALGSVSGSVSGDTLSFTITVTTPGCSGSFTGTGIVDIPQGGNLKQSFSYSGSSTCGGPESGTGILTLQ